MNINHFNKTYNLVMQHWVKLTDSQASFHQKLQSQSKSFFIWSLYEVREEMFFKLSGSHDQDGHYAHIYLNAKVSQP